MSAPTVVLSFDAPPVNRREVLRYAQAKEGDEGMEALLTACIKEAENAWNFRAVKREFLITWCKNRIDVGAFSTESEDLLKNLAGCERVTAFAATVGVGIDRLVAKYQKVSPSRALLFQALGAERIECFCDALNESVRAEASDAGFDLRPRFSPGYGDLPLAVQKDLFRVLDCEKKIGVTLGESLLMTPTKSVSAVVGWKKRF